MRFGDYFLAAATLVLMTGSIWAKSPCDDIADNKKKLECLNKELAAKKQALQKVQQQETANRQAQIKALHDVQRQAKVTTQQDDQRQSQLKAQQDAQRQAQINAQQNAQHQAQLTAQQNAQRQAQLKAQQDALRQAQLKAQSDAKKGNPLGASQNARGLGEVLPTTPQRLGTSSQSGTQTTAKTASPKFGLVAPTVSGSSFATAGSTPQVGDTRQTLGVCGSSMLQRALIPDKLCISPGGKLSWYQCPADEKLLCLSQRKSANPNGPCSTLVSFTSACDKHDACYGARGAIKSKCDAAFYGDLKDACRSELLSSFPESARRSCYEAALFFNDQVREKGCDAFKQAQLARGVSEPQCTLGLATASHSVSSVTPRTGTSSQIGTQATVLPKLGGSNNVLEGAQRYPVQGPVSQKFGVPWWPNTEKTHTGIDIAAKKGTTVLAVASGKVVHISEMGDEWGKGVVVAESNGMAKAYLHVSPFVRIGDLVVSGVTTIGTVWKDHLHYNVCKQVAHCQRGALPTLKPDPKYPNDPLFKDGPFISP